MSGDLKEQEPLRKHAEAQLDRRPPMKEPAGSADELLHELQVHQIELEMQNEALRQARTVMEQSRDRYLDLYDFSPIAYLTLTSEGVIREINLTGAALLGEERRKLLQHRFAPFVAAEERDRWHSLFFGAMRREERQQGELRLQRSDGSVVLVRLDSLRIGRDEGPPVLRLALTDISESRKAAEAAAEAQQALVDSLEAQVVARTAQLRAMSAQLTMAEERERHALGQDLHDNLGQLLSVIKIKLATFDVGSLESSIAEIDGLVDQAEQAMRMVRQQLSPQILQSLGLGPALGWLADEQERKYGLSVHIHDDSDPKLLDEAARTMVFRAVRELLINVARHAQVKSAEVTCLVEDCRLIVAVSDRGCGFDVAGSCATSACARGFGLFSIRERFTSIGGGMDIDSAPGEGSTITLTVPLAAAAARQGSRS